MGEIFRQVFNLSVTGSFLILAVIVVRLLLQKAPRSMVCILWILVGIRFLMPFSIESDFGIVPAGETVRYSGNFAGMPVMNTGLEGIDAPINWRVQENYTSAEAENSLMIWDLCAYVWIAGMVFIAGYFAVSWYRLRKRVRTAVPESRCGEKVYLCDDIPSPFLMGIVRPRIYLPQGIAQEAVPYVIAHEKAHQKRKDYFVKWIASLFLIVYWFHPLIWISYLFLSRDMEFACDEQVIRQMGEEHKKSYSSALLGCAAGRKLGFWCPAAFGETGVKSRVLKVLHYQKPALWGVAAAILLIMLTAVCFLTQKKETPEEGGVIAYEGVEFVLEEAVACKETDFLRLVFSVRSDGTASEALVREYAGLVSAGLTGKYYNDEEENKVQIVEYGIYNQSMEKALTLVMQQKEIGAFSPDLVKYEEADEYSLDSFIGKIRVLISPHSLRVFCEDGMPKKKEGGVLAAKMKNGELWKVSRIPAWLGESKSEIEFDGEFLYAFAAQDEEKGWLSCGYEEPVYRKGIQSFVFVQEE
ncbi:MAG: M56 family metallopeptidase [Lachnospiraceae bacterium]|nr:M56 family metallopeptidase [Lachnospiraceae bacterium]